MLLPYVTASFFMSYFSAAHTWLAGIQSSRPLPLRWMAPEMLTARKATPQTDVYSYGVVILECLNLGRIPFGDMDNKDIAVLLIRTQRQAMSSPHVGVSPLDAHLAQSATHVEAQLGTLMLACTQALPQRRPCFAAVSLALGPPTWPALASGALHMGPHLADIIEARTESHL